MRKPRPRFSGRVFQVGSLGRVLSSAVWLLIWYRPAAGVVIDRIAVIVDNHAIKTSDIDRDLRVTEFLNHEPLDTTVNVKRKAAGTRNRPRTKRTQWSNAFSTGVLAGPMRG
jgi:hypothetical protein